MEGGPTKKTHLGSHITESKALDGLQLEDIPDHLREVLNVWKSYPIHGIINRKKIWLALLLIGEIVKQFFRKSPQQMDLHTECVVASNLMTQK